MRPADCAFCGKLSALKALPEWETVWSFPHGVAFLGPWQSYLGYCIFVSRAHATELSQLDEKDRQGYLDEMCLLARAIEMAFKPHKLNYELLGNLVPHLHWHLFPRYLDDVERLKPVWLSLDRAERDSDLRSRLEATERDRAGITARLQQELARLGAPTL